jgi:hypothetical protein
VREGHAVPCSECGGMPDESDDMSGCSTCWGSGYEIIYEDDTDDIDD